MTAITRTTDQGHVVRTASDMAQDLLAQLRAKYPNDTELLDQAAVVVESLAATDHGQTVSEVPGQPGRVTTGRPQHVEIAEFDVFATIPGAYDDDLWPADLVMDTARVDENGSSVVTRAATVADLVDADDQDGDL